MNAVKQWVLANINPAGWVRKYLPAHERAGYFRVLRAANIRNNIRPALSDQEWHSLIGPVLDIQAGDFETVQSIRNRMPRRFRHNVDIMIKWANKN